MWKNFLVLVFFASVISLGAQTKIDSARAPKKDTVVVGWKKGGAMGINFTQASFTNWAAGGVNSISAQSLFNCFANYKNKTTRWDNILDLSYGLVKQNTAGSLRKADDRIDLNSKYGKYAFRKVWYYSALVNFKTQFAPGYTYQGDTAKTLIADFMAPGYLILAVGLDYKPTDKFSIFMAPLTAKHTFVLYQSLANAGAYGVEKAIYDTAGILLIPGRTVRSEFGGYFRLQFRGEIMKNVNMNAKLELFSNYINHPENVDVNTEVAFILKVNKYITANLTMQAIYDHDINISVDDDDDGVIDGAGPRLQFRQVLGVGFGVKF